ncbi:hypothetical protein PTTG_01170 [Puccinia triticina 1-1 BBBD Race 1]|uniref:MRC1 domain-containing protein n=1 Tax=Puccinia triticina (isolate 1-1 / race 1 (BBBD)) TaxID=630390 RepID=A0A180GJJ6_PUCT1|nr:hypothetical protein PTTG_01170 [Puccinia triticina 1-1 BBBD Race 1]
MAAEDEHTSTIEPASSPQPQHPPPKRARPQDHLQSEETKKKKKLRALSKKDREEAQRTVASLERQKTARLTATCRAPLTRVDDIIQKASTTTTHNTPANKLKKNSASTPDQQIIQLSDSDSDLEIINQPTTTLIKQKLNPSSSKAAKKDPPKSRRPPIPFPIPSSSKSKIHRKSTKDLLDELSKKAAYENALTRERKQAEFLERGGRLSNRELPRRNSNNPSEIGLKAILQQKKENPEQPRDSDDDEEDIDFACDDDDDEIGSMDDSGEDQSAKAEEDEDEIENSDEDEHQRTITRPPADLPHPGSPSTSKPLLPPVLARSSLSSSSSAASSSSPSLVIPKLPPSGQTSITSIILAPDSTSTDRESLRSSKPPLSEPSEPGGPRRSSSPIDLPGFQLDGPSQPSQKKKKKKNPSLLEGSPPLTGFGQVECSGIDGFGELEGSPANSPVGKLLLAADDEDDDDDDDTNDCLLPAVNVLPEEKERDMMMMALGAQDTAVEDDEQPTQYVNHRGLLTQNKPNGPPDSPLMSQDVIARTPFALRRDGTNRQGQGFIQRETEASPTKPQGVVPSSWRVIRSASPEPAPKQPAGGVVDAFAKVMNAQIEQSANPFKSPPPVPSKKARGSGGAGRAFLADEADESEDEYETLLGRRRGGEGGSGSDDEHGSEDEGSLKDLVDDAEDERDEQTRMKEELARRELDQKYHEELEARRTEHIQKVVDGKVRLKQARLNRSGDAAISESDSEDDIEAEAVKANKRAQEHAAKKKKRAIHKLADKHASFFKSYEEGTSNTIDEDDLAYLQPQEEAKKRDANSDEEEDEDDDGEGYGYSEEEEEDDDELADDVMLQGPTKPTKSGGQNAGDEDGGGGKKANRGRLSSSPVLASAAAPLPFKMTTNTLRPNQLGGASAAQHADLDDLYGTSAASKDALSARQRRLVVAELGLASGPGPGRPATAAKPAAHRGAGMSSSVTFLRPPNPPARASSDNPAAPAVPQTASKPAGRLAKLKKKTPKTSA